MKRVAHIYACKAKFNSGDYMLGISTKRYFEEVLLGEPCKFQDFDCRRNYTADVVKKINDSFDYILVGGGGLILPDSAPNMVSCWQWVIPEKNYDLITKPIYVVSVGYNLFYGQDMSMPNRGNNISNPKRIKIFKSNIKKLINKAKHFTIRHTGDMKSLISLVGEDIRDKVSMELCPSIWYVEKNWKPKLKKENKVLGIEIKDDREWRRYYKIGKQRFYNELTQFVREYMTKNGPNSIVYMSHDGSANFYRHLVSKGIRLQLLDNASANETMIMNNYSRLHTLLCSAGHSQMMAYGCGIKIISLASHPKLEYFCEDINDSNLIKINDQTNIKNQLKSKIK